ncbi:MAG: C13 family peptidase [Hyphomonadaceae bacterium]
MAKGLALGLALFGAVLASGEALAQRDPLGGQFGAIEVALTPAEAAKDVQLMGEAVAKLAPQRPGVVDTYVLSASFWNDPVFENEASEAANILANRYDAADRTIVLSAGRGARLPRSYPSASPNNFNAAIGAIGKVMDPKEDLLVVFVTSHGGPDGAVGIQEAGRMGGALRALHLRTALQQAGVGAKLVIISACFSGHFILPFSDPDTVVLTAAAADKTSFGCEPSRDWTFFGDALFNHAMRGGEGVIASFDEARDIISKWEGDMHDGWQAKPQSVRAHEQEPLASNPQKAAGERALSVIASAERYGNSIACAAHLSFALDRAKTGRPLKGLADVNALTSALASATSRANEQGQARNRSSQETGKAIAAASATALQVYLGQQEYVTGHATGCLAP